MALKIKFLFCCDNFAWAIISSELWADVFCVEVVAQPVQQSRINTASKIFCVIGYKFPRLFLLKSANLNRIEQ